MDPNSLKKNFLGAVWFLLPLGAMAGLPLWIRQCNRLELTKPTKPLAVSQNLLICVGNDTQWWIIRKITVKSRNDVRNACFWHVLCYISAIYEDIDLTFCTHILETLPSNICYVFLKWTFLFIFYFEIFKILKIRDGSFVALLILRHFI